MQLTTPILLSLRQLTDWRLLRLLLATLVLAACAFALLIVGLGGEAHHLLAAHAWLAPIAGLAGGLVGLAAAIWLFLPVSVLIGGIFQEPVCRAVEARHYPDLPPARGTGLAAVLAELLVCGFRVAVAGFAALALTLVIPGAGWLLGFALNAYALGRALFVPVAMRHTSRAGALALYREHRPAILAQGAILAALGSLPPANLLLPVLGPAVMLHTLARLVPPAR